MTQTTTASPWAQRPKKARIFPAILFLLGLTLTMGGGWLAGLGGSFYYVVTGIALVASAVLIWRGNALGGWLYALILAWTLAWALHEAGVDFWTLLPRLALLFALGLWLVTPWYRRTVVSGPVNLEHGKTTLTAFIAAFIVLFAAGRLIGDPHEIRSHGPLPGVMQAYPLKAPEGDWHHVGNGPGGLRFSELARLTPINVDKLELAWTYQGDDLTPAAGQATDVVPLKVADSLYFCTAGGDIVALDAETGEQRWRHSAGAVPAGRGRAGACRGVAFYSLPADEAAAVAAAAVAGTGPAKQAEAKAGGKAGSKAEAKAGGKAEAKVEAKFEAKVEAKAGPQAEPIANGPAEAPAACHQRLYGATVGMELVALDARTGEPCADFGSHGLVDLTKGMGGDAGEAGYVTSVPQLVRGRIVIAASVAGGEPAGVIRAWDARTGAFGWAFDAARPEARGEPPEGEHYGRGLPGARAPFSADDDLGLVFVATGQSGALHGEGRPVASAASAGSAAPFARSVLALDAETGRLVWQFRAPSEDAVPDELANQPSLIELQVNGEFIPALLQSTRRGQHYLLDRRSGVSVFEPRSPEAPEHGDELTTMASTPLQTGTPPDVAAATPEVALVDAAGAPASETAEQDMWGLTLVDQLWCRIQFRQTRHAGAKDPVVADAPGGAGPVSLGSALAGDATWTAVSFDPERRVMVGNWNRLPDREVDAAAARRLVSPLGAPCIAPPHALVTAVDLNTHQVLWERRAEAAAEPGITSLAARLAGPAEMAAPGGSVTTRGGLVFVVDPGEQSLRALDLRNGDLLWQEALAVGGPATPMTYLSRNSDRQFVLVAGSATASGAGGSGYLAAYALPRQGGSAD